MRSIPSTFDRIIPCPLLTYTLMSDLDISGVPLQLTVELGAMDGVDVLGSVSRPLTDVLHQTIFFIRRGVGVSPRGVTRVRTNTIYTEIETSSTQQ
jgi:hypothetical protein